MHLRVVASICALSTGLLIGSPAAAIAAADSGTDGATTQADSADDSIQPARGPLGSMAYSLRLTVQGTVRDLVRGVTGTPGTAAKPGQHQSSSLEPTQMIVGGTPTAYGSLGPGSSTAESTMEGTSDSTANDGVPTSTEPSVATPPAIEVASSPIPPPTTPAAPVPNPVPSFTDVVVPVSNAIAYSVTSWPALVAALPYSATPVSDVIASIQELLTSVADAGAPLVSTPIDIAALLGVGSIVPGATVGTGTHLVGSSVATGLTMPLSLPGPAGLPPALPGFEVLLTPDVLAGSAIPLDATTSGTSTGIASTSTVLAPVGDGSSVLSIVQHVISAFVATVSLTALTAIALPGILGLLGTGAAGIRIGYRQAKAGSELPATAMARFVGSGPIGVVRSGSQISLRPRVVRAGPRRARSLHADRPATSSALQLLDRAV